MRKLLMAFVSIMTAGLFAAPTAQAAARWTCEGAEYICGSSSSSAASSYDASERRSARTRAARNNDDAPKARARRQETASTYTNDDDRPARRRRAVRDNSESYSGGGGGGATYSGQASYYWEPQALASGGRFNPNALTAAHKTLPFGTRVRVTNQRNGQSVDVTINDRGPYVGGRIIDLSKAAAGAINMQGAGVAPVTVQVLGRG